MINVAEKIIWVLSGLFIIALVLFAALLGIPTTTPSIAVEAKEMDEQEFRRSMPPEDVKALEDKMRAIAEDSGATKGTGARGGRRPPRRANPPTYFKVNRGLLDRLGNMTNVMGELENASHKVKENSDGTNSLEIYDLAPGSIFDKVFEEHDIIDRIDGKKIDFSSVIEGKALFDECREKLARKEAIILDITRTGRPAKLVVAPRW